MKILAVQKYCKNRKYSKFCFISDPLNYFRKEYFIFNNFTQTFINNLKQSKSPVNAYCVYILFV